MKTFLTHIKSLISRIARSARTPSVHARALAFIVLCALVAGAYVLLSRQSDKTFDLDYAAYESAAATADNDAYVPGASTNPVRIALDQVLTGVLDQSVAPGKRLELANQGVDLLKQSESQLDDISSSTKRADALIAKMQVDTLDSAAASDKAHAILALAKSRSSIISDIRAYSYRTDFEISQIFTTIIAAQGVLSNAYVVELNGEIPDVETEFDKRTALYGQLQSIASQIADIYSGSTAVPADSSGNTAAQQ